MSNSNAIGFDRNADEQLEEVCSRSLVQKAHPTTAEAATTLTLAQKQERRKELMAKIAASTDADVLTTMLVPELDLATRAEDLKPLRNAVKAAVQVKLKDHNGAKPTAADMRELFPDVAKKLKPTHFSLTHYGVAQRVVAEMAGDLRFHIDQEVWLHWTGARWLKLRKAEVGSMARATANRMWNEAATRSDVDLDKLEQIGSNGFRRGAVGEMEASEAMHVEQGDLDQHLRYLACANGAVDLQKGKLVCERDLLVTINNDTAFDPEARCPLFLKLLDEAFEGREEDIEYYEYIMGYSLQANPSERAMFFHKGEGLNGKSLLLGAIMKSLGDHAASVSYKVIADGPGATMNSNADGASPSLHRLKLKRFAFIDEIPVGGNLRDADVKKLAGGAGGMDARGLHQETVEFAVTFVFHIACNTMGTVRGGQDAIFKRVYPVVYTKQFDAVEDTTLAERLIVEREGILAWLVRCSTKYLHMRTNGGKLRDHMPQSAKDELERIKADQSPFTAWIEANCEMAEDAFLAATEGWEDLMLYEAHVNVDVQKTPVRSVKKFVQLMKALKVGRHDTQVGPDRISGFWGLKLRDGRKIYKPRGVSEAPTTV